MRRLTFPSLWFYFFSAGVLFSLAYGVFWLDLCPESVATDSALMDGDGGSCHDATI